MMFQRLSFYPPQIKSSFTSRLFGRGKTGTFTLPFPASSSRDGSDPALESNQETSKAQVDRFAKGDGDNSVNMEEQEELEVDAEANYDEPNQDEEDLNRDVDSEDGDDELLYEAESPDEAALVHAARAYRCTLRARSTKSLLVDLPGIGSLSVQLLHILPFDSNRKRMSVVVRHPLTGQVVVYTKGADSVIMDLAETPKGRVSFWMKDSGLQI